MRRMWRLLTPGIAFAVVALLLTITSQWSISRTRNGWTDKGCYALVLAIVVTWFVLAWVCEPLPGERTGIRIRRSAGWGVAGISSRPGDFRIAVLDAYRYPFTPPLLLSFGTGLILSAIGNGVDDRFYRLGPASQNFAVAQTEVGMAVLLIVGAGVLLRWGRIGAYYGYCLGLATAAAWGEWLFKPRTQLYPTLASWGGGLLALLLIGSLVRWGELRKARPLPRRQVAA